MQDIIDTLTELINDADVTRRYIKRAKNASIKATKALETAQARIDFLSSPQASDEAVSAAMRLALDSAPDTYTREVMEAVSRNEEFAYMAFLTPLLNIADNEDLYSFVVRGTGWGKRLIVKLAMDAVAGPISDYSAAVNDTREYLNVGKSDPTRASDLWKKHYKIKGHIYAKTIAIRMQFADSPAPFWSLLNYGNKVNMSSSRGGSPYPSMPGTGFVRNTEESIEEDFRKTLMAYREYNSNEIKDIKNDIATINRLLDQIDSIINRGTDDIDHSEKFFTEIENVSNKVEASSETLSKKSIAKKLVGGFQNLGKVIGSSLARLLGLDE